MVVVLEFIKESVTDMIFFICWLMVGWDTFFVKF